MTTEEDSIKGLPRGFIIGTSISSHQTEGGNRLNDWHSWESSGLVPEAGSAANFWKDYRYWIDKAASVGNAFRMSLEWSRVEPQEGHFDHGATGHYRKILRYCKSKGLATIVTLHHFTNPMWLAKKGGWSNPDAVRHFCRYAGHCATHLGDVVDYWVTINEPQVYVGSRLGVWPEKDNPVKAVSTLLRMIESHKAAYRAIKSAAPSASVGSVQNIQYFEGRSLAGKIASKISDALWNLFFLSRTAREHDFIGVNYYGRVLLPPEGHVDDLAAISPYAGGLRKMLERLQREFGKPLMITENGMFSSKEDVNDGERCRSIAGHLSAISRAISSGADVRGYLHWTLMDNYEWHRGYNVFMGLFTRNGKEKASARFMGKMKRRRMGKRC